MFFLSLSYCGYELVFATNSKHGSNGASRRRFITAAGATSLALSLPAMLRAQGKKAMTVSVGRQPWAAGNSPITQRMMADKLFEKAASDLGYDLTVDWRDYPSAVPMVERLFKADCT